MLDLSLATSVSVDTFATRRQILAQRMGANAVAILTTRAEMFRNHDADYKYRADSSFFYLTGFAEPEAVAVLETDDRGSLRYTLFCRERNRELEIWTGYRAGLEGAIKQFKADQAFAIDELSVQVPRLLEGKQVLWARFGQNSSFDQQLSQWFAQLHQHKRHGQHAPIQMCQLDELIDEMRLIKSDEEISLMQEAARISALAHTRAMQTAQPNMPEYALEAELLYVFARHGTVPAYNSIVGAGKNACILHYVANNALLQAHDLVLIDAGCEYQHYAADITRTFPVSGQFNAEQRALYEVVLAAQKAAIEVTCIGNHVRYPHQVAVRVLTEGLLELGLLQGDINELISTEQYRQFYMHGTGHWLGMDVHDAGRYKTFDVQTQTEEWRLYQSGMVITVEPGLYIAPDDLSVDARWRGIGIRIEDDILVTAQGPRILTDQVVKEINDIEHMIRQ